LIRRVTIIGIKAIQDFWVHSTELIKLEERDAIQQQSA
jgi:hypothetical protein